MAKTILEGSLNDVDRAYAETKIVPTISLTEFYDSNVFIAPKGVDTGNIPWDLGTRLSSDVKITNTSRDIDASALVGVAGTTYVNNPDLTYVSTNGNVNAALDGWVGRLVPGLKLQISDVFQYTPEMPAFLPGGRLATDSDIFARGIQATRANTFTNTASVTGAYGLTPSLGLAGAYSYSMFTVGTLYVPPSNQFAQTFADTKYHSFSVGPTLQLTRSETLSLNYQGILMNLTAPGLQQRFEAHGGAIEYSKETPDWSARISGGATVVTQGTGAFFTGRATLVGKFDPLTKVTMVVSRAIAPAFFGSPGAMISTSASVFLSKELTRLLTLTASGNFALNESVPIEGLAKYETYTASMILKYNFTRNLFTELSYSYINATFSGELITPSTLLERSLVGLSINMTWN